MAPDFRRYRQAFLCSQRLLARIEGLSFPLDVPSVLASLCGRRPILLVPHAAYLAWRGEADGEAVSVRDAMCFYHPERKAYLIVYNETAPAVRLRFSLAHELGHILLGHLDARRDGANAVRGDDWVLEGAANLFAGNLLAPPILVHACLRGGAFDHALVAALFGLSLQAAREYRERDYRRWLEGPPDEAERVILARCRDRLFSLTCADCGAIAPDAEAVFCPDCAGQDLTVVPGPPKSLETDCGDRPASNACAETSFWGTPKPPCPKGAALPRSAKFCMYCGNDSLYARLGILE